MKKTMNRWILAVVGVIVLIFAGIVYAWTVLSAPIAASYVQWSKAELSTTFTVVMFCFCIGGFAGGLLAKKITLRFLLLFSAILFILGFFIASRASSLLILYLGFGIFGGLGSGLAYNAVMSSVGRWFPDKQGLISGILLMGFGIGSFLIGKVYTAVTPSDGGFAWRGSLLVLGIITAAVVAISAVFISRPPAGWHAPVSKNGAARIVSCEEINTITMMKRPSFWLFFIWAVLFSASGLAVVSQGTPIAMESMQITPETATAIQMNSIATIVGLISIFNGVGRILFGLLFDRIGRLWTMVLGCIVFVIAMLLMLWALTGHSPAILVFSYIVTGLGYGCLTPCNSAFISSFYGMQHYPSNFSIINLILLVSSFSSTIAGTIYDSTGSYVMIIIIVMAMILVDIVLSFLIKKPKKT